MGERTSYEPGTFSWVDCSTTDPDAGQAFYEGLFGWEGEPMPAGEGMTYTMFRKNGQYVAAISAHQDKTRCSHGEQCALNPTSAAARSEQ